MNAPASSQPEPVNPTHCHDHESHCHENSPHHGSELCFHTNEAVLAHVPVFLPDSPEWHLREEDYASLFEEYLTPDPVESFLNEIPFIQLEASSDRAACNMENYPMDA